MVSTPAKPLSVVISLKQPLGVPSVRSAAGAGRGAGPRALAGVPPRPGVGLCVGGRDRVADRRRPRAAAAHEARRRGPAHHHRDQGVGYRLEVSNDARHRPRIIRRRIAFKLTLTLVGFVGVSMVAAGFFLNHALEEFAVESLEGRLASVAGVVRRRRGPPARRAARGGPGLRLARGAPDGRAVTLIARRWPRRRGSDRRRRRPGTPRQSPGSAGGPAGTRGPPGRDLRRSATVTPAPVRRLPVRDAGRMIGALRLALPCPPSPRPTPRPPGACSRAAVGAAGRARHRHLRRRRRDPPGGGHAVDRPPDERGQFPRPRARRAPPTRSARSAGR